MKASPRNAMVRANDGRYNERTNIVFGSLCVHNDIFDLCQQDNRGKVTLVYSIPAAMATDVSRIQGCTITSTDKFSDNTYIPLPNVKPETFIAHADDLEKRALQAQESVQKSNIRQMRIALSAPEQMENDRLNDQLDHYKAQLKERQHC